MARLHGSESGRGNMRIHPSISLGASESVRRTLIRDMYGMSLQRLTLMRRLCWRKVRWASSMRVSVNRFGFLSVAPPLPEVYISAAYIPGRAVAEIYPMRVPGRSDRHGERITTMRYRIASSLRVGYCRYNARLLCCLRRTGMSICPLSCG